MVKAIIFDLYGTLIHGGAAHNSTYRSLFKDSKLNSEDRLKLKDKILKEDFSSFEDLNNKLFPNINLDSSHYEDLLSKELLEVGLYPSALSVLEKLSSQDYKLGLISNLASFHKKPFFDLGLEPFFDVKAFSCDEGIVKPNREIYLSTVKNLGFKENEVLMVGDNRAFDYAMPKELGLSALNIARISPNPKPETITSLTEIFDYLEIK